MRENYFPFTLPLSPKGLSNTHKFVSYGFIHYFPFPPVGGEGRVRGKIVKCVYL
jgi:hypothetical protein